VTRADRADEPARSERAKLDAELAKQREGRAELERGRAQATLEAEQRLITGENTTAEFRRDLHDQVGVSLGGPPV
jgi:hypothetical protein